MINSDDVAGLSGLLPEQRFCFVEQLSRRRLKEARDEAEQAKEHGGAWLPPKLTEYDYAVTVSAAAIEYCIGELSDFKLPWPSDEQADEECRMFRARATQVSQRLLFRHEVKIATVALDGATKAKISHWLSQMREAVQAADIVAEKKDRLFALINEFQHEVDRERTPVHAAGELWLTICTYVNEGANKLPQAMALLERIGAVFGHAKQTEDSQPKLPSRKEPKRIEPPKKPKFDKAVDPEIPF